MSDKPRIRMTANGWVRHEGGDMPPFLAGTKIDIITRSGNAEAVSGYPADWYRGWRHTGFSGDIAFWRPTLSSQRAAA